MKPKCVGCGGSVGRFGALRPEGHRFESHYSRHVETLSKSFICSFFSMLTPTQYQCCSRERLWVVVDLKRCHRNIRNEWMKMNPWIVLNCGPDDIMPPVTLAIASSPCSHMNLASRCRLSSTAQIIRWLNGYRNPEWRLILLTSIGTWATMLLTEWPWNK